MYNTPSPITTLLVYDSPNPPEYDILQHRIPPVVLPRNDFCVKHHQRGRSFHPPPAAAPQHHCWRRRRRREPRRRVRWQQQRRDVELRLRGHWRAGRRRCCRDGRRCRRTRRCYHVPQRVRVSGDPGGGRRA